MEEPEVVLALAVTEVVQPTNSQRKQHHTQQRSKSAHDKIISDNFHKKHKAMLGHRKMVLEQDPGKIAINPDKFDKLITALRTAVDIDIDGTVDKEATSYNDIFDAFRLALKFYSFRDSSEYDY